MLEQAAEITRTDEHQVWVKPLRSSCQSCGGTCSMPGSAGVARDAGVPLTVPDPERWSPGDRVLLSTPESVLLVTSLLVYGLPLLGLFAGALLGANLVESLMPHWREASSVAGALLGFCSGLWLARSVRLRHQYLSPNVTIRPMG